MKDKEFKVIPGFVDLAVNKVGLVINTKTRKALDTFIADSGYVFYQFKDGSKKRLIARHRAMCLTFKPCDNPDDKMVNHINGIKGDDRLDNLEWVTNRENIIHAGRLGINPKCKPIEVRDVDSGEVIEFDTFLECAQYFNVSKDKIAYRLKYDESRVWPERRQYRLVSDNEWSIPDDVE